MAQAGQLQFGVDETYLSNSVSRALIKGVNEAKRSGGALTPNINEQAWRMPLGRITGDVDKFKSSLNAANQRVIAFSASASVFYGISTALKGLVTSTISVNKNMTDLNAIFKLSVADLNKFKNELFDVARSTGQAIDTVSKSSIEFSRQGLGVQETLKRTRDALILTRLTGLDAAEAANTLTAAVNSFNKSGLGTTEILNKMVAADSAFAVSSKDIADALVRVGSSAQDAGVQFNELIALVTTTKQVTGRDGAVIGNALKTLLARQDRGTVIETLEKLGVTVRDASSNVLPYISVLKNLAKQYDTLGISQKQQVSQLLGGVYQSNILKALMSDLAKSNSVYEQSLNAVGKAQDEAIKRNEYLNSSLATTIENLKTSFTQISSNLGENVLNKNIKSIGSGINTIFGKEFSDSFANGLKGVDSEGAGNFIGQGLIKGISNVFGVSGGIPGAGLLAIGATLFKVLSSTLGTALKDMQNLLAFNEKSLAIQQGIDKAILGANSAEQTRLLTAKTLADQEQVILDILLRQKAAMQTMAAEKNALRVDVISNNPRLAKEAFRAGRNIPGAAGGLLPAIAQESHAISRGVGGASLSARPVVVPNFNFGGGKTGPIVANTDEYLVKNYAGGGSAIFNKNMVSKYGVPSGATRIAAQGYTPSPDDIFFHVTSKENADLLNKFGFSGNVTRPRNTEAQFLQGDRANKIYAFKFLQDALFYLDSSKNKDTILKISKALGVDRDTEFMGSANMLSSFNPKDTTILNRKLIKNGLKVLDKKYPGFFTDELKNFSSGYIPNFANNINISNQYGRLDSQIFSKDKLAYITWIESLKQGGSKELYNQFFNSLPNLGINTVKGDFIPQQNIQLLRNKSTPFKSVIPQIIRGRYGKSSDLGFTNDNGDLLAQILFGGGSQFDKDFSNQEKLLRNLLTDNTLTPTTFTTHLAGGHIPNFARRGRPSIKGRQIRYEGPMDFSSILGPEGLLELFTIFGFGLGDHPSKSTIDAKTLQKFGINIPSGLTPGSKFPYRNYAAGGIPNSVAKAIDRELKAGAPLSSIYVDSDPRLVSPKNPRGILVANRRDEPAGGFEGVNKYRELGLDPKAAGATHVPNFADPSELILNYIMKKYPNAGEAAKVISPQTYPSLGNAEKEISKKLSEIIKNVNLKDVDFLSGSQNISKVLQTKIKDAVGKSFAGVDFGKTSAFSKLSDEVLASRRKEISGLTQLQTAQKKAELVNQKRLEYEKRVGLSNIGEKIINTSSRMLSPEALAEAQARAQSNYSVFARSAMATKTPQELYISELKLAMKESNASLKRIVAANEIQQKLTSGIKYGQLTGLEQITLQKQFQRQAFTGLGFAGTGLTLEQTLRNKEARQQISQYVNREIAAISERPNLGTKISKWAGRINSAALPLAFGAPMLAGFIPEGQSGTTGGKISGGASGALQGLGTGAAIGMSFGPYGSAIGALAGTMVGAISGVASKWNKSFEEIGRDIENANAKNVKVINDIQLYIQQSGQITDLINSGVGPKKIKELIDKQIKLYSSFNNQDIRKAILSGNPEDALRLANQTAINRQLGGNIISSAARGREEVSSFSRLLLKLGDFGTRFAPQSTKDINERFIQKIGFGTVTDKNIKSFSDALLESSDSLTKADLENFSKLINKDAIGALTQFADKLNLTADDIKLIGDKFRTPELIRGLNLFAGQKTARLNTAEEIGPLITEISKRFQISQLEWQRAGLATQLRSQSFNIRGLSNIRNQTALESAGIELDPNLTEAQRISRGGNIQLSTLLATNRLNLQSAALQAQAGIASLGADNKMVKPEDLRKLSNLFSDVARTGNTGTIQKYIDEISSQQENVFNNLNDSNDEQSSNLQLLASYAKDQILKLNELIETGKSSERELQISNSLNNIRARDQQKQSLLSNTNYNLDVFSQARRNAEAARGISFTNTRYKEGLTLQAQLNEQDYLSSLGIAQSSSSLADYNDIKKARTKATLATLLSQETGQKISPYDMAGLESAAGKSRNASRFQETLKLLDYDPNAEIRKLGSGEGSSADIIDKITKLQGTDPIQNITAQNTGIIAESSKSINSDMVDGFDRIWSLMDSAFNKNKLAEQQVNAYRSEIEAISKVGLLRAEKQKITEGGGSESDIADINTKIAQAETERKKATENLNKSLAKKVDSINSISSVQPTAIKQSPQGETIILPDFEVTGNAPDKEVDKLSDSIKGFKQGLIDSNAQWMTFADLAESSGRIISSSLGNAFGEFVTGSMKGKDAFKAFASSILGDIAKMYAQQAMKGVISSFFGANTGGSILKFASGGSVPALLTGGEFYYTPSQASSIGQNRLHAINSGTAKFARGGLVSGGSGYMDDVPAMLDNGGFVIKRSSVQKYGASNLSNLGNNSVAMFASGGNVSPTMISGGSANSGGNTSVKIDIHDNRTTTSASTDDSVNDPEFNRRLSLAVKSSVLQTVQDQRRVGGILRQSRNY